MNVLSIFVFDNVFFRDEFSSMVDHDGDFAGFSFFVFAHEFVMISLDEAEAVFVKVFFQGLSVCDFLFQIFPFISVRFFMYFFGAFFIDRIFICAVFAQSADLPPVDDAFLIRFQMDHVRVDAADGRPFVIDRTPVVFKKDAGPVRVVFRPQGVAGDIKVSELIGVVKIRRRHQRRRVDAPDDLGVVIQKKDVVVVCLRAASAAHITGESDVFDDFQEIFFRVLTNHFKYRGIKSRIEFFV